ncbi:YceD family protein [Acidimangrovimonas pyrenivorans]|uniref:YceD family protein n=1 Tax=Acidimangrovimonas pyrenivorans TaxID=2030798 RepID=A0ABV7ADR3_9RHOB
MPQQLPVFHPLRVADLPARKPTRFKLRPEGETLGLIAQLVGADAVRKLSFEGALRPEGKRDFVLEARLGATVVQPCVVTLAPVTTRIEEEVVRRYLAEMPEPNGDEVEMPEDDSAEPLPEVIDPGAVMLEALALALPLYPRVPEAELGEASFAAPGTAPLTDEAVKPFAGLAGLRDKLAGKEDGKDDGSDDGSDDETP